MKLKEALIFTAIFPVAFLAIYYGTIYLMARLIKMGYGA